MESKKTPRLFLAWFVSGFRRADNGDTIVSCKAYGEAEGGGEE